MSGAPNDVRCADCGNPISQHPIGLGYYATSGKAARVCEGYLPAPAVAASGAAPGSWEQRLAGWLRTVEKTPGPHRIGAEFSLPKSNVRSLLAELAALREERDGLAGKLDMLADTADRLDDLMADAERLTWLQEHAETIRDRWSLNADEENALVWDCLDFERNRIPLREAIDAARSIPSDEHGRTE